jgi:glucose-fructose oxidoreductase
VYCINAVRNLFHDEPMEVFATTANNGEARFKKVEEMTSVIMRFRGERLATLTCSFGAAPATRYTLIGTKGTLTLDPAYEFSMGIKHQLTVGERTSVRTFPKRDQFAAELVYFSNCILNDEEPRPSGAEGLADVRVIRTIYESAQAGKTIQLPPMPAKHTPGLRQQIYKPTHGQPKSSKATSQSGEGV